MSQPDEVCKVKIGLSATFWDKKPSYSIKFNNEIIKQGFATNEIIYEEFEVKLQENTTCLLEITLNNKQDSDTVQSEDKSTILKDMILNVESIEIDEIELETLKWSHSEFVPNDSSRPVLKECVNLGWNGSYRLKFTSPFYLWLLENM